MIKEILRPFVPQIILNRLKRQVEKRQFIEWQKNDCPAPPPHMVKQTTIQDYQRKYGYTTFVETGTYLGDMVEAQKRRFKKIVSIEIGVELFEKAQKRFKNDHHVTIVQGDSGIILPQILKDMNEPAIFWLDGSLFGRNNSKRR